MMNVMFVACMAAYLISVLSMLGVVAIMIMEVIEHLRR